MSGTPKSNENSSGSIHIEEYFLTFASVGSESFSESPRLFIAPARLIAAIDVIHTAHVFPLPFFS